MNRPEHQPYVDQLKQQGPLSLNRMLRDQGLSGVIERSHKELYHTRLYGYLTNIAAFTGEIEPDAEPPTEPASLLRLGFFKGALIAHAVISPSVPGGYFNYEAPIEPVEITDVHTGVTEYLLSGPIIKFADQGYAKVPEYHERIDEELEAYDFSETTGLYLKRGFGFMFNFTDTFLATMETDAFAQSVQADITSVNWDKELKDLLSQGLGD